MLPEKKKTEAVGLFLLLCALCAAVIWVRTATVKDTYRYVQQERERFRLEQETQAIRIRWLQMTAPKRLEGLAKALGLAPPKPNQVLRYEAPATGASLTRNP
jgi:hypothetical protein